MVFASVIHLAWAVLLGISPQAVHTTPLDALSTVFLNRWLLAGVLVLVAACALMSTRMAPSKWRVALLLPQQCVLIVSALGAIAAIATGHYADGVARPHMFIAADQIMPVLLALIHTAVILEARWRQ